MNPTLAPICVLQLKLFELLPKNYSITSLEGTSFQISKGETLACVIAHDPIENNISLTQNGSTSSQYLPELINLEFTDEFLFTLIGWVASLIEAPNQTAEIYNRSITVNDLSLYRFNYTYHPSTGFTIYGSFSYKTISNPYIIPSPTWITKEQLDQEYQELRSLALKMYEEAVTKEERLCYEAKRAGFDVKELTETSCKIQDVTFNFAKNSIEITSTISHANEVTAILGLLQVCDSPLPRNLILTQKEKLASHVELQ